MTKTLLLLRHAKSSWKDEKLKDFDRPLKRRGEKDAGRIGLVLVEAELIPQVILSSPALRAKQTAGLAAEQSKFKGDLQFVDSFYPGMPKDYIEELKKLPDQVERVMVVGHNPGLDDLLHTFDTRLDTLSTGTLAYLSLHIKHWAGLTRATMGELISFWEPEEIIPDEMEAVMGKDKDKDKKDKDEKKKDKKKKDKKKDKK